jgi:cyclophilin family peptidyl-prolyl cis-trans isomerase
MTALSSKLKATGAAQAGTIVFLSTVLVACGGGGSGASDNASAKPQVTVSSLLTTDAKYGQPLVITIAGANLDQTLQVSSRGCKGMARSTAPSRVSTSTTAYFECAASAIGSSQVTVADDQGTTLASAAFTVAVPQVTLTLANGQGVSGSLVMTLAPDKAPATVDNFLAYVNAGFYDGTVFHRVVPGFVVQGGGYSSVTPGVTPSARATRAPVALEVNKGLSNVQWSVAMARTTAPDSATSQFFINLANNSAQLDSNATTSGYAVFGTVSTGTDLVSAVASAPCTPFAGFSECVPSPSVRIVSAVQTQ